MALDNQPASSGHVILAEMKIGSRIPKTAYAGDGEMLLSAGHVISTQTQLSRLLQSDVQFGAFIPIVNKTSRRSGAPEEDTKSETEAEKDLRRAAEVKAAVVQDISGVFARLETTGEIDMATAEDAVEKLQQEMQHNAYAVSSLAMLKDADAYTFTHSVNVSIICMYMALRTTYASQVNEIGVGSLLHDIGKIDVPLQILHKHGPLDCSEMNTMKRHPLRGAQILSGLGYRNNIVISCVLEHHEKLSGRGYPLKKEANAITPYGRMTAIADVFDALTTDRPYRKAMSAHDAVVIMTQNMSRDLDPYMFQQFIEAIGQMAEFASEAGVQSGDLPIINMTSQEIRTTSMMTEKNPTELNALA